MPEIPKLTKQIGTGIDIESVGRLRFKTMASSPFLSRTFTRRERAYCMSKANPPVHFAGTFAAKEAAFKAVQAIHRGQLGVTDFEVSRRRNGVPVVKYTGGDNALRKIGIKVSVSHTAEYAVAVALAFL